MDIEFLIKEENKPFGIRHRCYYFAIEVVLFIKECNADRLYYPLFDQLLRSATSIGANMVESSAGSSRKDWIKYLTIALKSSNETKYWLCLIRDTMDLDKQKIESLLKEADEISRIIATIIIKSNKNNS